MNKEGVIICSSDPERIHTFHEGAFQVIQTGVDMIISQENSTDWSGTNPGINMPISFQEVVKSIEEIEKMMWRLKEIEVR